MLTEFRETPCLSLKMLRLRRRCVVAPLIERRNGAVLRLGLGLVTGKAEAEP